MDEYIVSARKYRPMSFDSVVGQMALTTTLKNAVKSGHLAHAYLFCGPRGVGKTTCARIFAKAINCLSPTAGGEACNECESCKAFNEQRSYSIYELDAASNNSVENIKLLMEQTRIPPQVGRYKVFIIDEVHMLSTAAFNAFLKTLEEPPAHVIFILATTEKHKILPTIISRCQIYDFERITVPGIIDHLKMVADKEGIRYEEEALNIIAEKADGGMRDALSTFDQAASFCQGNITLKKVLEDLNVLDADNYFQIIDNCLANNVPEVMVLVNSILTNGFDGGQLVGGLAKHVRNLLMAKDPVTLPLLEASQRQTERYKEQAAKCPLPFLYKALKIANACDINYRQSSNKRLLVELTLIQVAQITQPDDEPVAGRSPRRLKTLFKKIMASLRPNAALQVAAAGTNSNTTPPEANNAARQASMAKGAGKYSHTTSDSITSPSNDNKTSKAAQPAIKLTGIGMTFANITKTKEKKSPLDEAENKDDGKRSPFTDDMLQLQWLSMCNRMPDAMRSLSARMKNMKVTITTLPNVEAVVPNQMLMDDIMQIKGRIRNTLALALNNSGITLTFRLAQADEIKQILSPQELFTEMKKSNPAIDKLSQALQLEFT